MASRPTIRVKVQPRSRVKVGTIPKFPAQVVGGDGIAIEQTGGVFTFSLDLENASGIVQGPPASNDNAIARWDGDGGGLLQSSEAYLSDTGHLTLPASGLTIGSSTPFSDSGGVLTFQNVDVIDTITRRTIFSPYVYLFELNDDEGANDQSTNFQAQIDYCEAQGITHAKLPPYRVRARGLTIAHPLCLEFAPGKVFEGDADDGLPGESGTRLIAQAGDTDAPIITILTGSNGAILVNPQFEQDHGDDASFVAPTAFPPCVLNLSAGTRIINPKFWSCYDGIQFGQLTPSVIGSGQCSVIGMRAACFRYGINVVMAGDWISVRDYEFQAYMLGNLTNQLAYVQANAVAYHSERNDGPSIADMKCYGVKGGVLCESNAQGVTNILKIHGLYVDHSLYAIWNKTSSTLVQAEGVNFAGQNNTGSFGIECDSGAFVSVEGFQASFCGTSAAITTGTGQIAITNAIINRANNDNVGAACFTAGGNGKITLTGIFHRSIGANPMLPFLGGGTFVQSAVTSSGTGDYQMILKNSEDLTGDRTLTFKLFDASRTVQLGGNVLIGSTFETTGAFVTNGATSLPAVAQGDLWYGSATGVISALAKSAGSSRFLKNSGAGNNPAWVQPAASDLSNGTTGSGSVVLGTGPTISGGGHSAITSLGIRNTVAAFDLTIASTDASMTAGKTLIFNTNNANRTINLGGNVAIGSNFETVGSGGLTLSTGGATNATLPLGTNTLAAISAMAAHNAAVNGGVTVGQELGTTGATLTNNTAKYTADCWEGFYNHGAATAVVTSGQITAVSFGAVLAGHTHGHRLKATTAISSIANGDFGRHRQKVEGYRIAHWGWGATGARQIVVAFQLYSTSSGTGFVRLSNSTADRFYYHEVTVAAGWNYFSFLVVGDTSGTWLATNGTGLVFEFFAAGKEATPQSSLDAWGATAKVQTTNSTNLLGTNNNETVITGLYVDAGNVVPNATELAQLVRPYPEELRLCKRYFNRMSAASSVNKPFCMLQAFNTTGAFGVLRYLDVPLRNSAPTAAISNIAHIGLGDAAGAGAVAITGASVAASENVVWTTGFTGSSGLVAGNAVQTLFLSTSGYVDAIDRL